ncbi:FMNH2-dependent dimethyl sulfone monooxygenase [Pseudonocardia thermophila]|jgi:dimethyl sulfone monooxygenase SfnG|uniref:FMNH2-dependent dimethyl sulfone monooxygenase n=1 Tax=Pseudonocardia thermophila TaxID=1848 RepID=A0A1M7B335_PSETH|nr:dimethyl sulfone monooxygenase SfnG [Pseudonocardia thermophila]SHL49361.1 FMNH2-dependent dimethyl sulfone monooxygenase [Pseudonocardia thermophila]
MADDARPAPLEFAYWVPNVSGGLVTSTIEQRTDWGFDYNKKLAQTAEKNGFSYALSQVRYMASYGADHQHEPTSFSLALLLATERLKLIAAVHPGLWQPAVLAKWVATADHLSNGRIAVNVVSGWFKQEFIAMGEPWLEHDERYRRAAEFMQVLREIWTKDEANFSGDFYRVHDFSLKPKPLQLPGRPHPEIFQGGNSTAARYNGGYYADWYFSNGKDYDGFSEQVTEVLAHARDAGRTTPPKFALNGFMIARDSAEEARETLREIIAKADRAAVEGFRDAVQQAGASTRDKRGMWADSTFEDLVQYNDGFRTKLIGTPEQIADRAIEYKRRGASLLLLGFLHFQEEVEYFGKHVLPIIREKEAELDEKEPVGAGVR